MENQIGVGNFRRINSETNVEIKQNGGYSYNKTNDGCASHAALRTGSVTLHQSALPSWVVVGAGPSLFYRNFGRTRSNYGGKSELGALEDWTTV